MWATTSQQSSQHVQVSISTPTTSSGVPCVPLPTDLSSHTKEVPSTSSHTHHHQVPPGSLCYNYDPIPSQHLSNFVFQVEIPAQCTQTTMYNSPPAHDSVATTVAVYCGTFERTPTYDGPPRKNLPLLLLSLQIRVPTVACVMMRQCLLVSTPSHQCQLVLLRCLTRKLIVRIALI